jgi:electron transfer flavoprotein beta subunit
MDPLVCIKRVPNTGASAILTEDKQSIDTSNLGYTLSPHEECGIEEAVQLTENHGGTATAMTLGPEGAEEQLETAIAMGMDEAVRLEGSDSDGRPSRIADALANAIEDRETIPDLLIFGNEAADAQNYQVGVRVAEQLGLPCVTGIKELTVEGETAVAEREIPGGAELFELDLPAVITVKEGLNEPRYPSMRARMQASKTEIETMEPQAEGVEGFEKVELFLPEEGESTTEILGDSPDAAPRVVDVLDDLEVL